jgi:signal transduction histidine kinase
VAQTGVSEIVNDTYTDERALHIDDSGPDEEGEKLMAIPLSSRDGTVGVLAIWRTASEASFLPDDLEFGTALANHAGTALCNARAYALAHEALLQAEEANRMKARFLATVSHELRTPLNAIINFSFLLSQETEGAVNGQQADLLSRIETSGRNLLELINDILDLAKVDAGRMELNLEDIDPLDFARETARPIPGLIGSKPIRFEITAPASLPAMRADRMRIRQVLLNLLSNAAKFTNEGSITLDIGISGGKLRFTVADTGIGMDERDIPRAFSEFTQLDSGANRNAPGTGLGLSIATKLVELHGSRLEVQSALGKGTRFHFELPLAAAEGEQDPRKDRR